MCYGQDAFSAALMYSVRECGIDGWLGQYGSDRDPRSRIVADPGWAGKAIGSREAVRLSGAPSFPPSTLSHKCRYLFVSRNSEYSQ